MDKLTTLETLSGLAAIARELRAAGVLRVRVEGVELELAPAAEQYAGAEISSIPAEGPAPGDPLDDPATFGNRGVPRLRKVDHEVNHGG